MRSVDEDTLIEATFAELAFIFVFAMFMLFALRHAEALNEEKNSAKNIDRLEQRIAELTGGKFEQSNRPIDARSLRRRLANALATQDLLEAEIKRKRERINELEFERTRAGQLRSALSELARTKQELEELQASQARLESGLDRFRRQIANLTRENELLTGKYEGGWSDRTWQHIRSLRTDLLGLVQTSWARNCDCAIDFLEEPSAAHPRTLSVTLTNELAGAVSRIKRRCGDANGRHIFHGSKALLFDVGQHILTRPANSCLRRLCPKLIEIALRNRNVVSRVAVEGHTSSDWAQLPTNCVDPYECNVALSMRRSSSVYSFCKREIRSQKLQSQSSIDVNTYYNKIFVPEGWGSRRVVRTRTGAENRTASRRVEFRFQLSSIPE